MVDITSHSLVLFVRGSIRIPLCQNSATSEFRYVLFQYYTSHLVRDASRFLALRRLLQFEKFPSTIPHPNHDNRGNGLGDWGVTPKSSNQKQREGHTEVSS